MPVVARSTIKVSMRYMMMAKSTTGTQMSRKSLVRKMS